MTERTPEEQSKQSSSGETRRRASFVCRTVDTQKDESTATYLFSVEELEAMKSSIGPWNEYPDRLDQEIHLKLHSIISEMKTIERGDR
jgi:hypothetical protein